MIPDYDDNSAKTLLMCDAEHVRQEIENLKKAATALHLPDLARRLQYIENQQRKVWHSIAYRCEVKQEAQ